MQKVACSGLAAAPYRTHGEDGFFDFSEVHPGYGVEIVIRHIKDVVQKI